MSYKTKDIRNVAIMGHSGEGKTTLCEAILYNARAISRMGTIVDGNTVMDFDDQEIKRKISISLSVASCEFDGCKINLIDVPGFYDFEGEQVAALSAADSAIIVLGPNGEVSVGCEKAIEMCQNAKVPMMVFINQVNKDNADIMGTIAALKEKYGTKLAVIEMPIMEGAKMAGYVSVVHETAVKFTNNGPVPTEVPEEMKEDLATYRDALIEVAAENDEALLDKFFEEGTLTQEEVEKGLRLGISSGSTIPVIEGSGQNNKGIIHLMETIVQQMPSPLEHPNDLRENSQGELVPCHIWEEGDPSLKVFKTIADPYVGKLNIFKVMTGTIKNGLTLINQTTGETEKISQLYAPLGKKENPINELCAGDIGAVAKLKNTNTCDTLTVSGSEVKYAPINFPKPVIEMAVSAVKEDEEEKVIQGLYRLAEEDATFNLKKNKETGQMLISGMGETHINMICKKLKNKFKVEAKLEDPKIPYRETIKKTIEAEGKHKKQSGGHGQYGHCKLRFEPCEGDFEFASEVVGGSVPKNYIPAIEKGLRESIAHGVIAGYPVVGLKAVVYDGSYHPVDSSEMAFKIAASVAYKKGLPEAKPVLLEPIMKVTIVVPEQYMGDILGDMNKRRGAILGMEAKNGKQVITAEVPQAEMFKYATDLRSITQARGLFEMEFVRYQEAPSNVAEAIAKEHTEE